MNTASQNLTHHLGMLRDDPSTRGLLPKVMAAYNAGPNRAAEWIAWNTYRHFECYFGISGIGNGSLVTVR